MLKNLHPLRPYLWKHKRTLLWGALSVLLMNGIWVLFPQVLHRAVDDLNRGVTREQIVVYSLVLVAIDLSTGIFQFLTRCLAVAVSREIEYGRLNACVCHLNSRSLPPYHKPLTTTVTRP